MLNTTESSFLSPAPSEATHADGGALPLRVQSPTDCVGFTKAQERELDALWLSYINKQIPHSVYAAKRYDFQCANMVRALS